MSYTMPEGEFYQIDFPEIAQMFLLCFPFLHMCRHEVHIKHDKLV